MGERSRRKETVFARGCDVAGVAAKSSSAAGESENRTMFWKKTGFAHGCDFAGMAAKSSSAAGGSENRTMFGQEGHSLIVQLIIVPMAILGIIVVGQLLYGIRVANIMNANAREIRTATLREIASGLQTDLNQYKLFVANHMPDADIHRALTGQEELASFQAKQDLEQDWTATFQLYPDLTGIFLETDGGFLSMINPRENYESRSYAVAALREWTALLRTGTDPYPYSWTLLNHEDGKQILVCVLQENGCLFGVWLDVEGIRRKVNQYYENQYQYMFTERQGLEKWQNEQKGSRSITVYATLENGRFAILEQVGRQELLRELYRLNNLLAVLITGIILMMAWYMYMNYRRIARGIRQLIEAMNKTVETGNIILARDNTSFREFHQLVEIYNAFLSRIDSLEDHIAKEQIRYQTVRRQYLELQIRPHFYVNIISGVLGYLNSKNTSQAKELLNCMAAHLSYVLYNKEGRAKLGDELQFARNYLEIQRLRFGDRFMLQMNVDEEYYDVLVPVLSIQTFIENTAKYVNCGEDGIQMTVDAQLIERNDAEYLRVTIEDNGSGYPEEILAAFRNHEEMIFGGKKHIGIQNLFERMRQLYGDDASLELYNSERSGAVACWVVPIV